MKSRIKKTSFFKEIPLTERFTVLTSKGNRSKYRVAFVNRKRSKKGPSGVRLFSRVTQIMVDPRPISKYSPVFTSSETHEVTSSQLKSLFKSGITDNTILEIYQGAVGAVNFRTVPYKFIKALRQLKSPSVKE